MPLPPDLEARFPGLAAGYEQTSDQDPNYNCIAHAVGESDTWWEPVRGRYWPARVPRNRSLQALQTALGTEKYASCESGDLEDGLEKVAIFANDEGEYTHIARQLADGSWTSKFGRNEDIRHRLRQLEGNEFGSVVAFMGRPRR
jgi:hypothetical protein